jgi:hypothetical protein
VGEVEGDQIRYRGPSEGCEVFSTQIRAFGLYRQEL